MTWFDWVIVVVIAVLIRSTYVNYRSAYTYKLAVDKLKSDHKKELLTLHSEYVAKFEDLAQKFNEQERYQERLIKDIKRAKSEAFTLTTGKPLANVL